MFKKWLFVGLFLLAGIMLIFALLGCDDDGDFFISEVHKPEIQTGIFGSVNKYVASPYTGSGMVNKIKYSFTYEDYDFYYIYLGELNNIPIYSHTARYYDGEIDWTYTVTTERITQDSIREAISENMQTTIGVIDSHTVSRTTGGKTSAEINAGFGIKKIFNIGAKVSGESNWSNLTSNTSTNSLQRSTSLTDTVEHASSYTWRTLESDQFRFNPGNRAGYYRYTLFSASDVYLYVIRDSKTNEIFFEFIEHVIPGNDAYFWRMDYSETASFRKSDATSFEFDVSLLSELSKSELKPKLNLSSNNLTGEVKITGTPQVGQTLTANIIILNSGGPYNYQWMRNGTTQIGSNSNTYTLQSSDEKSTITVVVTCNEKSGSVTSNATSTIFPEPPFSYTLTVNRNPSVGGTTNITSLSNIGVGTPVNITATANNGYRFANWTVESGTATFSNANNANTTVTLSTNAIIRANFQQRIIDTIQFNTTGNYTYSTSENIPATIEVYALGAGGGGQGGHTHTSTHGIGGAGGGGAAAYMKFDATGAITFNIDVGGGGIGGAPVFISASSWRSGLKGRDGGSTIVSWGSNTLIVAGGKGGGEGRANDLGSSDTTGQSLIGGSGGAASVRPSVILQADWGTTTGEKGGDGIYSGNVVIRNEDVVTRGGIAGTLNIGSLVYFGGGAGGYIKGIYGYTAGIGAGAAGSWSRWNYGSSGGDGLVTIVVTHWR
jgi:hypothetical protein